PEGPSPKRKRASSAPCAIPVSTGPRRESDTEILPNDSISALWEGFDMTPPRQSEIPDVPPAVSTVRHYFAELESASTPIIVQLGGMGSGPLPQRVKDVKKLLDRGWIPGSLRTLITEDSDLKDEEIEDHAWDGNDGEVRDELAKALQEVKEILEQVQE